MRRVRLGLLFTPVALAIVSLALRVEAQPVNGAPLLRMLGARAQRVLEPGKQTVGAVVRVPHGIPASLASTLRPLSPGFARIRDTPAALVAFADAHPDLGLEVAPPLHLLLDKVGQWTNAVSARSADGVDGTGTLVGIADTGIDFTLADFADPVTGRIRVAWLLDLAATKPANLYPALEAQYGGAVYAASDLSNLLGTGQIQANSGVLTDTVGHGTHVASIAAGNGGASRTYVGIAPGADLVVARISTGASADISTADLLVGVQFLFDRADAMHRPIAANLSIGSDFGPHDGTMAWEQSLAAYVGPTEPGHALAVAAGNSGDITSSAVHATVFVPPGGSARSVPIAAAYAGTNAGMGQVQVWVTMRGDADLAVGLDAPGGTWIGPVGAGATGNYGAPATTPTLVASIYNGSAMSAGQIPAGSHSAIVVWQGDFAAGTYSVTLTGHGVADLFVEGVGDAIDGNGNGVGFVNPVREGTINLPATSPGILAVGCTINRATWTSIAGGPVGVGVSPLDPRGGYALVDAGYASPSGGDVCWFSSAGPTVTGVPKPEISAPGGLVIAAMSAWAPPSATTSIFNNPQCPPVNDAGLQDDRCMQVDDTHAVAAGTSMSSPQAAGAAALLFQKDPTLTQGKIVALLQAGAHPFRSGATLFEDQGGPGELDVQASLDALDQLRNPALALPSRQTSWVTLSADVVAADGSTPLTAIVELRTADGAHRADFFDPSRLTPVVKLDAGEIVKPPALQRVAPGLWTLTVTPPPGLGGHTLTLGADFDGAPIVTPRTVAIATEIWTANYPGSAGGGCGVVPSRAREDSRGDAAWLVVGMACGLAVLRRRRGFGPEAA